MKPIQFNFAQNSFASTQIKLNSNYTIAAESTSIALLDAPRFYDGYMNGFNQPVVLVKLQVLAFNPTQMQTFQESLNYLFAEHDIKFAAIESERDLIASFGESICALQKAIGLPIYQPIKVEEFSTEDKRFVLWIPSLMEDYFHQIMRLMIQLMGKLILSESLMLREKSLHEINELIHRLKYQVLAGTNSLRLLNAAHQEDIPWRFLAGTVFQYGYGRQSRWFDSTFTDKTSTIGSAFTKDKFITLSLLRRAGLPVPEQVIVGNEDEAVEAANMMGYPVVIKPHNQDRGDGVYANLISDTQVKKAFNHAKQYSDFILLEKHIFGKDYRLLVLNEELIWAFERIPAGVTGDGVCTITQLIEKINQDVNRGSENISPLKKINISDEMIEYLADQGYDLNTIPALNQFIRVSRIANVSKGGVPIAVFDKVHPDNKRLVETAANVFRVDLVGIDLIIPDIQYSYLETGGAIIEINSQPQLGVISGMGVYNKILLKLLPQKGRIPIMVICSDSTEDLFIHKLSALLAKQYQHIGIVKNNSAYLNGEMLSQNTSLYNAAEGLLFNKNSDVLIYCINAWDEINHQGLPFDRYDNLFFLEYPNCESEDAKLLKNNLMATLFNACSGYQLINESTVDYLSQFNCGHEARVILPKDKILHDMENYA